MAEKIKHVPATEELRNQWICRRVPNAGEGERDRRGNVVPGRPCSAKFAAVAYGEELIRNDSGFAGDGPEDGESAFVSVEIEPGVESLFRVTCRVQCQFFADQL